MQDKLQLTSQASILSNQSTSIHQDSNQYVLRSNFRKLDGKAPTSPQCFFMSIPDESLTHVTAFVADPPSLLALSRVNRRLRDHIADDNTWYRAFAFHFLLVGPECEPDPEKTFMLRRSESTWRKEYVMKFNLARRWERSRSAMLSYPHFWTVSSMHLLENLSLLTASLAYGIVTRSIPLTGKILKGHLDASGTTNGFGVGNPNEEFSPNVVCITLSSRGGTARIAWGFRDGEIALTFASRVMDSNRSAARYARCRSEDKHVGEVRCVAFAGKDDELLVTGCTWGQVKVWDTKRMRCLWTGVGTSADAEVPVACLKLAFNTRADVLVAAFSGGEIIIWWGFRNEPLFEPTHELRVTKQPLSKNGAVRTLLLDPNSSLQRIAILVHHVDDDHFLRLVVDLPSGVIQRTIFADGPLGPLTSIKACFATPSKHSSASPPNPHTPPEDHAPMSANVVASSMLKAQESSFILAGDSLGNVCAWNWEVQNPFINVDGAVDTLTSDEITRVSSTRKWEAHDDGAICAIEIRDGVIVTGSTRGTVKVWDSLTLTMSRSFPSPAPKATVAGEWDPVRQIIVRGDLLVVSIGSRIFVWRATTVTATKKGKQKSAGNSKRRVIGTSLNKWQQQIELNRDLRESQRLLEEERAYWQRIHGREREQLSTLEELGLDEREAVEYLLMLSREEEEQRRALEVRSVPDTSASGTGDAGAISLTNPDDMEGVFSLDDSPIFVPFSDERTMLHESRTAVNNPFSLSPFIPSNSNSKAQLPPPFQPGSTGVEQSTNPPSLAVVTAPVPVRRLRSSGPSPSVSSICDPADTQHFPEINSSSTTPHRSLSSLQLTGSWKSGSPSNSFVSPRSGQCSSSTSSAGRDSFSIRTPADRTRQDGEDEEMKYVLEMSLAEAISRGEA